MVKSLGWDLHSIIAKIQVAMSLPLAQRICRANLLIMVKGIEERTLSVLVISLAREDEVMSKHFPFC